MSSAARSAFARWCSARVPARRLVLFQRIFAAIWLAYDLADMASGGTAGCVGLWGPSRPQRLLLLLQCGLAAAELGLLVDARRRSWAWAALLLRAAETIFFLRLNDFYYFCATAFILAQLRVDEDAPAWVRDVLLWQAAWMYFATALLKLNPVWLAGGHLFVRHQYLAARGWPYPALWRGVVGTLSGNAWLARAALAGEFGMAALLAFGGPPALVAALAAAIHGYAAVALNVWFFGASMTAQVGLLSWDRAQNKLN